jgi:hypothetical protein
VYAMSNLAANERAPRVSTLARPLSLFTQPMQDYHNGYQAGVTAIGLNALCLVSIQNQVPGVSRNQRRMSQGPSSNNYGRSTAPSLSVA